MQSICWGAYPDISRFMNRPSRGPVFTFGPTIEVAVSALHHADREVLKSLSLGGFGNQQAARRLVRSINEYGARTKKEHHESFYRVWYFEDGAMKRYPDTTARRDRRTN
jgi:hypothetical protein